MLSIPQLRGEEPFPSVSQALNYPNGLLAIGGDLSSSRLQHAYKQGIFPWFSENDPILWWSPDPRAVLYPQGFIEHRSFKKFLKQCTWKITLNTNFKAVIRACSENRSEGTWITPSIQMAYYNLHNEGIAHSVEVWQEDNLIGGLYGIAQGALFCGESMFSNKTNASKIALWAFCKHFSLYGGQLIDCQILNPHTQQLGAIEIPRQTYIDKLKDLQIIRLNQQCWKQGFLNIL